MGSWGDADTIDDYGRELSSLCSLLVWGEVAAASGASLRRESGPNSAFVSGNRRATIGLQRAVSAQPQCNNAGEKMVEGQLRMQENELSLSSMTMDAKYTPSPLMRQ